MAMNQSDHADALAASLRKCIQSLEWARDMLEVTHPCTFNENIAEARATLAAYEEG